MIKNTLVENKGVLWLLFIVIAIISFYPYFNIRFGSTDDLVNFMGSQVGNFSGDARYISQVAGRFYFYLVRPFHALPFLVDNLIYVKVFHFIPILFCLILFGRILFELTKSLELSLLWLLLFFVTSQLSGYYNLLVCYPFYFSFSFALIMTSFLFLIHYYRKQKKRFLIYSIIIFTTGLVFYETYLLYLIIFGVYILGTNYIRHKTLGPALRASALDILPFFIVSLLYIAIYFIYRHYHPPMYDGTMFAGSEFSLAAFFQVIFDLSYTSLPLTVFDTTRDLFAGKSEHITGFQPILLNVILKARIEWIVKGLLVGFVSYHLLFFMPKITWKMLVTGLVSGIILIAIPQIFLAITQKYIYYVVHETMIGYLTTFFSLFGVLLIIVLTLSFLVNHFPVRYFIKQTCVFLFAFGFFVCSVLTDFSNYYYAKDIRNANAIFTALNELLDADEFQSIPEHAHFYTPDLFQNSSYSAKSLPGKDFKWSQYFWAKNRVWHETTYDMTVFQDHHTKMHAPAYLLTKKQDEKSDEVLLIMARLHPVDLTDSLETSFSNQITLAYFSPYKQFTLSFQPRYGRSQTQQIYLSINEKGFTFQPENKISFVVNNVKLDKAATIFTIEGPEIDINSIMTSNMSDHRLVKVNINLPN